jgi:metal-sulfur cluster biosynthetic enzyme
MSETATTSMKEEQVWEALYRVIDPEIGINIVDLGLVYFVDIDGTQVQVTMTLTTPGCPLHDSITAAVKDATRWFVPEATDVSVNLVWDPRWTPDMITERGRYELGL